MSNKDIDNLVFKEIFELLDWIAERECICKSKSGFRINHKRVEPSMIYDLFLAQRVRRQLFPNIDLNAENFKENNAIDSDIPENT